ncbi:AAA domain containing [Cryptosporidium sp. chipmunk genotype I]|uniref:AAA domain containing n=1 Tax=Cryptosporidium sp. chipmunk genotype I TaxID=1280935 RepID=UPI00351A54A1|nr:AAA domain containing [Cryptosporidium sp. chipmunk genotype I]
MGMLNFISKSGDLGYRKKEGLVDGLLEGVSRRAEWKHQGFNGNGNENENNFHYLREKNLLEVDDTLRGLLIKNLYSMDINDEVLRGILGEGNTSFKPGDILGIMGSIGSGKSLLMMHLVAISILPEEMGGHDQKVYFIDTDSGFSIEVFTEKHLIPIIEKKITNQDFYFHIIEENFETKTKIPQKDFSEIKMKDEQIIINQIIKKSLSNLNIIFVNDLLDLLCVLKQIISNSSINYFNTDCITNINTKNNFDSNDSNNKAKLLVIDSINFWNADLSSFIISNHEKITSKYHILGYFTNKNTIFNSIFSLIRQIVQFHGFIGILSICEEPIIQFTYSSNNSNNNITNNTHDKFKNNFTEELVEVVNLFQSKKHDQNIDIHYDNYVSSKKYRIEIEDNKINEKLMLKFPRIMHKKIFPNFLSKIFNIEDFQSITNIIWIAKSSLPISEQIHNYPSSCIIPTYFSCISVSNLQKSYFAFNDFHGLVLV